MHSNTYDVVIVGAGIMGLICAYDLAKAGKKILVLEQGDSCDGSGRGSNGVISWFTKQPGYHRQLFMRSWELLHDVEQEVDGVDVIWKSGSLTLAETELELNYIRKTHQESELPSPFTLELLDNRQTLELEPNLRPDILGALYVPDVAFVELLDYTFALRRAAVKLGVQIRNGTKVTGLIRQGSRIMGVHSSAGDFFCETVLNCAGIYGAQVGSMAGVDLEITPRRGQTVVCQQTRPIIFHNLYSTLYNIVKYYPDLVKDEEAAKRGLNFTLHQSHDGGIYISGTRENAGFDLRADNDALRLIVQGAVQRMPCLKDVLVLRIFSGLRPSTPDGLPVIGPVDGLEGYMFCAGHEGDGVALSPVTGQIVSDLLTKGHTDIIDIAPLSPMRFLKGAAS